MLFKIPNMELAEKLTLLAAKRDTTPARVLKAVEAMGYQKGRTTLFGFFSGKSRPDLQTALLLARVLEVPLEYLADDAAEEPPASLGLSEAEREIVEAFRESDVPQRRVIRFLSGEREFVPPGEKP